jgi:Cof subfamily protein (haloacid dehalogenase superfamily)
MYRLFASDVDDTLLAKDGSLPEATHRALQVLHQAGVAVVLSSGRATSSMRPIAARIMDLADDEYLISYNGGRVVTALSDHVVYEQPLAQPLISSIMEYCRKHRIHTQGYEPEGFVVESGAAGDEEKTLMYSRAASLEYRYVDDMPSALEAGSVKMLLIGEHEELVVHRDALTSMSRGRYEVMFSKPHYLEIVSAGVSKGRALTMLADKLGIPLENCIAMGDSTNDIDMIRTAGMGVAVANAREDLKSAAGHVLSRSSDEAALVELVQKFFPELAAEL